MLGVQPTPPATWWRTLEVDVEGAVIQTLLIVDSEAKDQIVEPSLEPLPWPHNERPQWSGVAGEQSRVHEAWIRGDRKNTSSATCSTAWNWLCTDGYRLAPLLTTGQHCLNERIAGACRALRDWRRLPEQGAGTCPKRGGQLLRRCPTPDLGPEPPEDSGGVGRPERR